MAQQSLVQGAARLPNSGLERCVAKFQQKSASSPPMKPPMSLFGQGSLLAEQRCCFFCRGEGMCAPPVPAEHIAHWLLMCKGKGGGEGQ